MQQYKGQRELNSTLHEVDFCVVGGGLAGMFAAISAARHGAKVALMQDRPVLGGNASSEIRMWVGGARHFQNRETGILEEICLENMYRNPYRNYSIWDSILYEKVKNQANITLLLNCSCNGAEMDGERIVSVRGWQTTTYTWHTVQASLFADCSGDSVLADLTGAEYRVGREASNEFGESLAPAVGDTKTMGLSCLIQARETDSARPYVPPNWAHVYESDEDLQHRPHSLEKTNTNYWWMELGGDQDSIGDTEELRDELLKVAFGVWDHIKNRGEHGADNWELDWVGFLPGKRESRRYVGDHMVCQDEVQLGGKYPDVVAYGGWGLDDHHPGGINHKGKPNVNIRLSAPYGLPYRSLYSRNISNLLFAGRNISVTHAALSSSRVMATCAMLGQAVGTAAAIAVEHRLLPRGVYKEQLPKLQQRLLDDDCYLLSLVRTIPECSADAELTASVGDPSPLRNGFDRALDGVDNGWTGPVSDSWVQYRFAGPQKLTQMRFVFDSDLERVTCADDHTKRKFAMSCNVPLHRQAFPLPKTMVKAFQILALDGQEWKTIYETDSNYQRLVRVPLDVTTTAIRFVPLACWGTEQAHVFAWDVR